MPTATTQTLEAPPWEVWEHARRPLSTSKLSEVQQWLSRLPFRMQGTVFAAIRGGDLVSKPFAVRTLHSIPPCYVREQCGYSHTDDAPERQLVQWLRWLTLRPADEREVDHPGSYMQSRPPHTYVWKPSMLGAYPMHWYMHLAHAYEVVGYEMPALPSQEHPHGSAEWLKTEARGVYERMVTALHLVPETRVDFWARMTEDRLASGNIVS